MKANYILEIFSSLYHSKCYWTIQKVIKLFKNVWSNCWKSLHRSRKVFIIQLFRNSFEWWKRKILDEEESIFIWRTVGWSVVACLLYEWTEWRKEGQEWLCWWDEHPHSWRSARSLGWRSEGGSRRVCANLATALRRAVSIERVFIHKTNFGVRPTDAAESREEKGYTLETDAGKSKGVWDRSFLLSPLLDREWADEHLTHSASLFLSLAHSPYNKPDPLTSPQRLASRNTDERTNTRH